MKYWRLKNNSVIKVDDEFYFSEDEVMLLVENVANYISKDEVFHAKREAMRQLMLLKQEVELEKLKRQGL